MSDLPMYELLVIVLPMSSASKDPRITIDPEVALLMAIPPIAWLVLGERVTLLILSPFLEEIVSIVAD